MPSFGSLARLVLVDLQCHILLGIRQCMSLCWVVVQDNGMASAAMEIDLRVAVVSLAVLLVPPLLPAVRGGPKHHPNNKHAAAG